MANVLKREKQTLIINALAEGTSIRSIERMTGVHRDTIMRLGARVCSGCTSILDKMMYNLTCKDIQVDEIWGFVGSTPSHYDLATGGHFGAHFRYRTLAYFNVHCVNKEVLQC